MSVNVDLHTTYCTPVFPQAKAALKDISDQPGKHCPVRYVMKRSKVATEVKS